RYEVFVEQYVIKTNIEAETTFDIAKTSILPVAIQYYNEIQTSGLGLSTASGLSEALVALATAINELGEANLDENHPTDITEEAAYMCDTVLPKMLAVREAADELERIVPDNLWPLPKYREILFVK
ncbi:MAG: glutamine synthetase type III, partial [Solirubrobacteraceae bacterium]|nr:glutamine synthetase type III [Solirubrobacteraceae bacterium]